MGHGFNRHCWGLIHNMQTAQNESYSRSYNLHSSAKQQRTDAKDKLSSLVAKMSSLDPGMTPISCSCGFCSLKYCYEVDTVLLHRVINVSYRIPTEPSLLSMSFVEKL